MQYEFLLLVIGVYAASGCASGSQPEPSPEQARSQLQELGIPFTAESFVLAVRNGDSLAVALFVEAGMDPDETQHDEATPLVAAVVYGQTRIARLLLARGADPNRVLPQQPTPLYFAAAARHVDTVEALLEAGADSSKGYEFLSPMAAAASEGHVAVVRLFVTGSGRLGQGLAMVNAITGNHPAVVRLLAEHGHGVDIGIRAAEQAGKPYLVDVIREASRPENR